MKPKAKKKRKRREAKRAPQYDAPWTVDIRQPDGTVERVATGTMKCYVGGTTITV